MKIKLVEFISEPEKAHIELLPTFTMSWYGDFQVWIGWLFWHIVFTFK